MNRTLFAIGVLALLGAGCVPLEPPTRPAMQTATSSDSSSAETANDTPLEAGDIATSSEEAATATGTVLQERITTGGLLEIGSATALHTLTVYTNHACTYCAEFSASHLPRLLENFVATGELKLQIAAVRLNKYPNSAVEAVALVCAGNQGRGRDMHHALFGLNPRTGAAVTALAKTMDLDSERFEACRADPAVQATISTQEAQMSGDGITLVPTLVLDDERSVGLPTYADVRGWIEAGIMR